jgi:hypothetical protein
VLGPDDHAVAPLALRCLAAFEVLHRGIVLPVFLAALGALPGPLVVGSHGGCGYDGKENQQELVADDSHGRLRVCWAFFHRLNFKFSKLSESKSTSRSKETDCVVDGKKVVVGVNAYIPKK